MPGQGPGPWWTIAVKSAVRKTLDYTGNGKSQTAPGQGAGGSGGGDQPDADRYRLRGQCEYDATGPLGGGYFNAATPDDESTLNVANQITLDGTFFDRQNLPTIEQGFNVPFART